MAEGKPKTGLNNENQRMWDLLRYHRQLLFEDNLITRSDLLVLVQDHAAVKRLEDYDEAKARWDVERKALVKALRIAWNTVQQNFGARLEAETEALLKKYEGE